MSTQTNSQLIDVEKSKERLNNISSQYDPDFVEAAAVKELATFTDNKITPETALFKALTMQEFENGILMTLTIPEQYKTFAIDTSRKLQKEYNCRTVSEKATCELAALSYIRMLEAQRKLNCVLSKDGLNESAVGFIAVMGKEVDRATRHYFSAIQTLRMMKQSPLTVTIKAQTAIVGQNQIVQSNNN